MMIFQRIARSNPFVPVVVHWRFPLGKHLSLDYGHREHAVKQGMGAEGAKQGRRNFINQRSHARISSQSSAPDVRAGAPTRQPLAGFQGILMLDQQSDVFFSAASPRGVVAVGDEGAWPIGRSTSWWV
jgi:hypothetical protein